MSYQKSDPTNLLVAKFLLYNDNNKTETKIDLGNTASSAALLVPITNQGEIKYYKTIPRNIHSCKLFFSSKRHLSCLCF